MGWQTVTWQVDAVDSTRDRNVNSVIHDNAGFAFRCEIPYLRYEFEKFSGGQVLFPDLDQIDAVAYGTLYTTENVRLKTVRNITTTHSVVGRLTIFTDLQKRTSSESPSARSTTPSPDTAPRTKLLRRTPRRCRE